MTVRSVDRSLAGAGSTVAKDQASETVSSTSVPHSTSIAVWDVPSPVIVDRPFTVKVGLKCVGACRLAGQPIVVRDEGGHAVGEGRAGEGPWGGTRALFGAEVTLPAPAAEGMHSWTVTFDGTTSDPPHAGASAAFSLRTAGPPEHQITIVVINQATAAPLADVQVRLGVYRAATDTRGRANLEVSTGSYGLSLWKVGYVAQSQTVEVTASATLQVEVACAPDVDADDEQHWM